MYRILLSLILPLPLLAEAQILQWSYDNIATDLRQSGANPDLFQSPAGDVYLSFWNSNLNSLSYAIMDAGTGEWTTNESFLSTGPHGFSSAIIADDAGFLHLAYMSRIEGNVATLRYATNQSGSWVIESPIGDEDLGPYGEDSNAPRLTQASIDIEMQPNGEPIISVYDGSVDAYAGCIYTSQATYLQYDLKLRVVSRDLSGTWTEGTIPDIPNLNYPGCLPQGDRYGEFCQIEKRSDGTMFVLTNSLHNHDLLLFRSDSTDYLTWDVQLLDSLETTFSGNLRFFDTFEQPTMVMHGDTSLSILVSGSEQYGFTNSLNRHILAYYRFEQDTGDADLFVQNDLELFPTLINYRSNLTMSSRHPDTIFQAFVGIRDNFLQIQHTYNGGQSWEVDSVDLFVTDAPLMSTIVGDSLLVIGFDQFRNAVIEYRFPTDMSSMSSRYITVQESRGEFIRSVVTRSGGTDQAALIYPESFSESLIFTQNQGGTWQEETVTQSTAPVSGALALQPDGSYTIILSDEDLGVTAEYQNVNGAWIPDTVSLEVLDQTQLTQDNDSLYFAAIGRNQGDVFFLSRAHLTNTWTERRIDTIGSPHQALSNVVVLTDGTVKLAYSDLATGQLSMSTRTPGSGWTEEIVTQPQSYTPIEIELRVNSSGEAVIAFKDGKSGEVVLAEQDQSTWTLSEVPTDPGNLIGSPLEMILDTKDRPWVLYNFPDIQDEIRLLRRDGSGTWFGVSVLNNTGEIANEFQLHLIEDDFYVFGRKNDPADQGIASLFAAEGVRTLIGTSVDYLQVSVFPNPAKEIITTSFTLSTAEKISLNVYNLQGQLLHFEEALLSAGPQTLETDLRHLPAGSYLIGISTGDQVGYQKLVLIR